MMNFGGEYLLRSINPGNWQISVEAKEPFHNTRFVINDVRPGMDIDLGSVHLQK